MFTKRRILIYTISSAVTLILITFCIFILLKNKNFEKEYSINISFPSKNSYEDCYGCSLKKLLSFRKFKIHELTNDESIDNILFKKIQFEIRNLVKNKDSNNGIHIKLNLKTKYEDVIKIIDICEIEKAQTYLIKDYDVWIMTGINLELKKNCPLKYPKP